MFFCFSGEIKKDKDLDEEKSPKTETDDTLEQIHSAKQEIAEGTEALTGTGTKEGINVVVVHGTVKETKEEPKKEGGPMNNTSKSTSEQNSGPLPSEHTGEVKKSDEVQKALKNDQQAKIPLKKREMKRSEDFDPANCGGGGSSIIVRYPAVKEVQPAKEENGLSSETLNGNASHAVAVEGDMQPSDNVQIKQEPHASSNEQQIDAEFPETKIQFSGAKQGKEQEEKQKKEDATAGENQTIKGESIEMEETAVSKDQEMSPKLEEAGQPTEKSSESKVIQLRVVSEKAEDESVKMEVAEDCLEPPDKEAPEKPSVTKPTDQAENEKKPETLKESPYPNERDMDYKREEIKHESDINYGTRSPITQMESADQEKRDAPMKTKEPPSPVLFKTEKVANKDKTMDLGSADTKDNSTPTDTTKGTEQNVAGGKDLPDATSKDCDAEPQKEASNVKGVQCEHSVEESKASVEYFSEDQRENGEHKSTSATENLSGESTEDQVKEKEKTKMSKGAAEEKKLVPEIPQVGIQLKIKAPAHRRRVELLREEGKGDSESEANEGRCLRRSPRICRPTAKLAEIQDRKVEKKQITPAVEKEKEKEENEEKGGEENTVQNKLREKKVDQEGQAKPKVCVNVFC